MLRISSYLVLILCALVTEPHLPHLVKLEKQYILKCNGYTEIHITPVVNYLWEEEAKYYRESNILGLLVGWRDTARMAMRWRLTYSVSSSAAWKA